MGWFAGAAAALATAALLAPAFAPAAVAGPTLRGDTGEPPAADTTAPDTTIGRIQVRRRRVRIEFSSSEPGGSFRCNFDSQPLAACSSPLILRRLKPGRHRVRITAIDAAGNADPTGATAKFRIRKRRHGGDRRGGQRS